ncbi:Glycosyltransferase involved in cell wall bisynthesis [Marisediminitalea aggregata]|uniref:Glycosyltransferase involved in cell wall bisynthesis n=1 Tax=Marisediminitalea aggregata TaxID=634436 RepID=A0A1M5R6B5_9ALTE|nr:glycosyltransferase family 4 protein [Marisediminitalea aggregata]MEC7469684.1 glycosyltransferase family 4 protein [Pseudomonadota bacterium]MEC7826634.1 glycosyltransferase family 4 protein [Pseudomonadota bacterium]SHH21373.1 Glycosyltransferase involved in cell wall bisynthesis [Marisediminitalea aggregata]
MTMVKHVVMIHERFPPDYAGGGEYVVHQMAKHLQARGIRITVLTTGDPEQTAFDGIKTIRIPCSVYAFNLRASVLLPYCHDADVIQAFTYHSVIPATRVASTLNIPLVKMMLALFGKEWRTMKGPVVGRLFEWFERKLVTMPAAKDIYISDFSQRYAESMGISTAESVVIEPGISLEDYTPGDKSFVMFAGKLNPRKGLQQVITAARSLPQVEFVITGWGSHTAMAELNDLPNVRFEPFTNRLAMADLLSRAAIFVFPTRVETFGLAVAEAMASGCAIVSSSELPFAGIKVDATDSQAIAEAIQQLINDPERMKRDGQKNRETALTYNWQSHTDDLLAVYQQVKQSMMSENGLVT